MPDTISFAGHAGLVPVVSEGITYETTGKKRRDTEYVAEPKKEHGENGKG